MDEREDTTNDASMAHRNSWRTQDGDLVYRPGSFAEYRIPLNQVSTNSGLSTWEAHLSSKVWFSPSEFREAVKYATNAARMA